MWRGMSLHVYEFLMLSFFLVVCSFLSLFVFCICLSVFLRERKVQRGGKDLGEDKGGKTMIRIYSIKIASFSIIIN